jgi:2-polyprenyl-3-methyl-5-hydroxy-6-metoxy-1,4-benzoquinol methylase
MANLECTLSFVISNNEAALEPASYCWQAGKYALKMHEPTRLKRLHGLFSIVGAVDFYFEMALQKIEITALPLDFWRLLKNQDLESKASRMVEDKEGLARFSRLSYEEFRLMATNDSLSRHEKIGFPDSYRSGRETEIFADILKKLPALNESNRKVLDIGSGCSDLPFILLEHCQTHDHELTFLDSAEMLAQLPENEGVCKIAGKFPDECLEFVEHVAGTVDVVIVYSVLHYVLPGADLFGFVDRLCQTLAPGGCLLLGDIPNISKRKRFFASENGREFHKAFMNTLEAPVVAFNTLEYDAIDDAVIISLVLRGRLAGFDVYVLPQAPSLPMANRREDLLICRP